ncbi:MAG: transcriptional activator protein [Geminicoccaceae bacterium]|jgi:DNA-binding SARP family transcriptional activator/Tfp pilus assembly protein PilF|nr:transcriptional activator protein [Geminicoccaceae bacterium]MDF2781120.1 transcriptional activator protein [Geminicoccaceae bacterium]
MSESGSAAARLHLLGRVRLETADGRDVTPRSSKARGLLAYLALSPEGAAPRAKVASLLWGESMAAMASLRQAVKEIRNRTAEAGLDVFAADHRSLRLDLEQVLVDVLAFDELVESAAGPEHIQATCARGLLEDESIRAEGFEDWLVVEQTRCRQHLAQVLEVRLTRALSRSAHELARSYAECLLVLDPVHEQAHRALMRCHADAGDLAGAIRRYEVCRTVLARELDLSPSIETESLLQEIRARAGAPPPAQRLAGRSGRAERAQGYASLGVAYHVAPANDAMDQTLGMALASRLREALSRIRWLSVLDREALILPGSPSQAREVADYDVRIGLLRGDRRVRMLVELRSIELQRVLRADHSDRPIGDDLFDLVDDLAIALAGRIDREVQLAEITRVRRKPLETLTAYERVLRAIPLIFELTPETFAQAGRMLQEAQEDDPHEAMVYAWRAFWYSINFGQDWVSDPEAAKAELEFLVRRGMELDPRNALVLSVAGHIASYVNHDYERALALFETSLRLDPSSAYAWDSSAITLCYAGRAEEALKQLGSSADLWQQHPDPYYFRASACIALLLAGQPEEAVAVGRRAVHENPNFQATYRPLIAGLGLTGRQGEAERYLRDLRRLHPDFSLGWFKENYPPLHGQGKDLYLEGLRKAGVRD